MANISGYLQAIMDAVYGEEVRGSIHDAISIINDVGEKVLTIGTAVTSSSSSTEGFFNESLYLNKNTWDLWKCNGSSWVLQGNIKGNGIKSVSKKSTSGLTDTYEMKFDDNTTYDFDIKNGNGIRSFVKSQTIGLTDTYIITFDDGTTKNINVKNGKGITAINKKSTSGNVDTYQILYNDSTTSTFTVTNGSDGYSPTVSVSKTGKDTTITITDATGDHTFHVLDGADGQGSGDMLTSVYDKNQNGIVDAAETAETAESVPWSGVQNKPKMTTSTLGIGSPDGLTTTANNGVITANGVAILSTVNPSGTEHGANWLKHGNTVLTPSNIQLYLVWIDGKPTLWNWNGTEYVEVTSDSGVTSYSDLTDKPSINGVELNGAMTSSILHIGGMNTDGSNSDENVALTRNLILGRDEERNFAIEFSSVTKPQGSGQLISFTPKTGTNFYPFIITLFTMFVGKSNVIFMNFNGEKKSIKPYSASKSLLKAYFVVDSTAEINETDVNHTIYLKNMCFEGGRTFISGGGSITKGSYNSANGDSVLANDRAHAEGFHNVARGYASHAEGEWNGASGDYSHVEGAYNYAYGEGSHAEGKFTEAYGSYSHTEGKETKTTGLYSHAGGIGTLAAYDNQMVIGKYNQQSNGLFVVGNGSDDANRSNTLEVYADGTVNIPNGNLKIGGEPLFYTTKIRIKASLSSAVSIGVGEQVIAYFKTTSRWSDNFTKYKPAIFQFGRGYNNTGMEYRSIVYPISITEASSGVIQVEAAVHNLAPVEINIKSVDVYVLAISCPFYVNSTKDIS